MAEFSCPFFSDYNLTWGINGIKMKHIYLTVLLSTAITSVTNASDVGTGYFEGETGIVKVLERS